ncbi:nicotinate-nucleotide--dimethylbenzimidazole phosphoribosyltransferase [Oleiphilus sp. HI0069]|uniref:nicotinate-nucleotide--dimethylbenzimidazole phosphoribosyltransferase n=1 Tax=Oleiphilus sp. HI0061 TaxID=1822239 RepID=UPI0007CF3D9F|nr:nicotinate-nucleotide--dimethylbenzimidazole phosphoribosyltransferase [Oleiphilus sp. HI0061]KZY63589.1 nicotinate-nucleotide--dimethylbenzimidazole phosphoribosyltransferase [Oleiphilus sp. HI0061]KZY85385.1 nicotinate-nucleotide--dimethylbenzimidazole phosphoribosyltransferase [Oleiphilus sp. HI0069]
MQWLNDAAQAINLEAQTAASTRQGQLTKPPGSLGQLESLAIKFAGLQGKEVPTIDKIMIRIFAADHGVVDEGVSAFPQIVTGEMVKNFAAGGAAITVLARQLNADFGVINLGTVNELAPLDSVTDQRITAGTANFCQQSAMSEEQLSQALEAGAQSASQAKELGIELFIGGEMGIGNTTSASALTAGLTDLPVEQLIGRGTGIDDEGIQRKLKAVQQGLDLHKTSDTTASELLAKLGGFEIAGLVGAYIRCAQLGISVLVDGFISSAAALVATRINPSIRPWLFFSHCSEEAGHKHLLQTLEAEPLLSLGMRLGEASGAAVAVPLLQSACLLHAQMATFDQAGVSQ